MDRKSVAENNSWTLSLMISLSMYKVIFTDLNYSRRLPKSELNLKTHEISREGKKPIKTNNQTRFIMWTFWVKDIHFKVWESL